MSRFASAWLLKSVSSPSIVAALPLVPQASPPTNHPNIMPNSPATSAPPGAANGDIELQPSRSQHQATPPPPPPNYGPQDQSEEFPPPSYNEALSSPRPAVLSGLEPVGVLQEQEPRRGYNNPTQFGINETHGHRLLILSLLLRLFLCAFEIAVAGYATDVRLKHGRRGSHILLLVPVRPVGSLDKLPS